MTTSTVLTTTPRFIAPAHPLVGPDERAAVESVLRSGALAQGAEVAAFEAEFAEVVDGRECVAVNSGTSALHLGMLAAGIGLGDEVIVPSFTFAATANAVALCGATPVFADIDPETYCLDPAHVGSVITARTAAIMPVHLFGQPAPMAELVALGQRHGLAVFEDACQAHLATLDGTPAGAFGDVAAFSFYPTKNMTTGEGGMVVCADPVVARRVRLLRNQGMEKRYANELVGFNTRMTEMAAAMGRVQLRRLPGFTATRRHNAALLSEGLARVSAPVVRPGAAHVYHQFTVRAPERDRVVEALQADGIGVGVYYPTPVHRLPAYSEDLDLPVTAVAAAEVLSLPVHPALLPDEIDRIISATNSAIERLGR
ncbi:MAG: DegT/DnrJ/EryC1/StrS family aminotransferase [Nocardioidaceae bacterium]